MMAVGMIALSSSDESNSESVFECPKCGSSWFGASAPFGVPETKYQCHDEFNCGCGWIGTRDKCFYFTYSKQALAQALLEAYKKIEELENK